MDSREFLEQVDWETNIYDVVLVSEETEETPAQWRVTVKPKDQNDIGSDIPIEIDFYLIDNMGNQFRVIDKEYESIAGNILVSDDFRCGWCPQPDLTGLIVKTVGNGAAPHVSSAKLDRLDSIAKQNIANREKDILWKYPKDINEKWHPEGLLFTADPTNNKIINWVAGKIVITLWPENLISDYVFDNVLLPKSAYHPERKYTIDLGTFTCADDELVYIYAVLPLAKDALAGSIVIEKTYRPERYYTDMLTVLMGSYTIPDADGKRSFLMQWSKMDKQHPPVTIAEDSVGKATIGDDQKLHLTLEGSTVTVVNNYTELTNVVNNTTVYDITTQAFYTYVNNEWITVVEGGGDPQVNGLGMSATVIGDLGTPSEVNSTTVNEVTATSHTHKLGNIALEDVVSGSPVEYGALYNWWAATDSRKITSSDDWVVPTSNQFWTLLSYVDNDGTCMSNTAAQELKTIGQDRWDINNISATNSVGFNAVGAGRRLNVALGGFNGIDYNGTIWCIGQYSASNGERVTIQSDSNSMGITRSICYSNDPKYIGHSIRLLYTGAGTPTSYMGNDGKVYPIILIGTQYWLAANLNETKYRNGDWIHGFDGGIYTPISNAAWAALTTEAMCYYDDTEAYGGGETPLTTIIDNKEHNSLKGLQGGTETERYHLTADELAAVQASGSTFQVHIKFEAVEAFTYTCPYALKFTAMIHQQTNAPTLSVALNTNMAQYDDLVITPDEIGLVTLTGEWL